MSIAVDDFDPLEQVKIRLRVVEVMSTTMIAFVLRSGDADQRRQILGELRRNLLLAIEMIYPSANQANVLAVEENVDRVLDEIARLARNA
jgi:hypothetical protein